MTYLRDQQVFAWAPQSSTCLLYTSKTTEQWAADVKADKEIGGDKLISNLSAAQRALDQFGTCLLYTSRCV